MIIKFWWTKVSNKHLQSAFVLTAYCTLYLQNLLMDKLLKAIVFSNVWVGLACASLTMMTTLQLPYGDWLYPLFVGLSTATAYNYMRIVQKNRYLYHKESSYKLWVKANYRAMLILTALFTVATIWVFVQIMSWNLVLLLIVPGIVSALYPITFKNRKGNSYSLRMIPGVKLFLIAFCWAYVTHAIPILLYDSWDWKDGLELFFRTLFVAGLTIPFDVRDLKFDLERMKTLPQLYGVKGALGIAKAFFTLYQLWIVALYLLGDIKLTSSLALVLGLELGYWIIRNMNEDRDETYCSIWIEGIPIYIFLLMYGGTLI